MNKKNKLSPKLVLFSYLNSNQPENIYIEQYNPISKLLQDYEEFETILNLFKRKNLTKILYINSKTIEKILYDAGEIVEINSKEIENDLNYFFYLSLLIKNSDIVNYSYKIDLINKINEQYEKNEQNKHKKIMISKIILDLIIYYEDIKNESESNESPQIPTETEKNLSIFQDFKLNWNLEDFKSKKIDEIYTDLIISIIKRNDSYEDTVNILKELDLENINITKTMKEGIFKLLEEDNFISKYKIEKIEDIFDEKKLQFFSILFKYILKSHLYIYQNKFLFRTRNIIIKLFKSDINQILKYYNNSEENKKEQVKFVLQGLLEFDYYLNDLNLNNKQEEETQKNNIEENNNLSNGINNENNSVNESSQNFSSYFNGPSVQEGYLNKGLPNNEGNSSKVSSFFNRSSVRNKKAQDNKGLNSMGVDELSPNEKSEMKTLEQILTKSSFKFHTNKKDETPFIIYDEIKYEGKSIADIKEIKEKGFSNAMDQKLVNSYKKFIAFLKRLEKNIQEQFENKFKLEVILEFKRNEKEEKKNDNSSFYNIICIYNFISPNDEHSNSSFKDVNILNAESLESQEGGYGYFIKEINSEDFKDIEYKE